MQYPSQELKNTSLSSYDTKIGAAEYMSPQSYARKAMQLREEFMVASGPSVYSKMLIDAYEEPSMYGEEGRQAIAQIEEFVRDDLTNSGVQLHDETTETFVSYLQDHNVEISEKVETRAHELEHYKQEFMSMILGAIELGEFPLSKEQLVERLSQIVVLFADPTLRGTFFNPNTENARFNPTVQAVFVDLNSSPELARHEIFHELLHAISGVRIKKQQGERLPASFESIGLQYNTVAVTNEVPYRVGVSFNEGIVNMVALALARGESIDFTAEGDASEDQWLRLFDIVDDYAESYDAESMATIHLLKNIDAKLVFASLFKSDFDEREADRLAGTHADRDLQRQIKIKGGIQRIKQLRLIDGALATHQENDTTELPKGLAQAIELGEADANNLG